MTPKLWKGVWAALRRFRNGQPRLREASSEAALDDGGIYAGTGMSLPAIQEAGRKAIRQYGNRAMSRVREPVDSPNAPIIRQDLSTPSLVLPVDPTKGWDAGWNEGPIHEAQEDGQDATGAIGVFPNSCGDSAPERSQESGAEPEDVPPHPSVNGSRPTSA
jgi:hypothetical protein